MTMIAVEPGGIFRETTAPPAMEAGGVAAGVPVAHAEAGAGVLGIDIFAKLEAGMRGMSQRLDRDHNRRLALAQGIYPLPIDAIPIPAPLGSSTIGILDQPQQLRPTLGRYWDVRLISASGFTPTVAVPAVSQPAVPASTVAAQNVNQFPVQVVISGGTGITAVVVNGVTVGTADGTYTVPANGAISVTYTTAPTWVWTALTSTTAAAIKVYVNGLAGVGGNSKGTITTPDVPLTFGKGQLVLRGPSDKLVFTASGITGQATISLGMIHVAEEFAGEYFR